jgi:hypothetical protein
MAEGHQEVHPDDVDVEKTAADKKIDPDSAVTGDESPENE